MRWSTVILGSLAAAFAGFLAARMVAAGAFVKWQHLPPPPAAPEEIIPDSGTTPMLELIDGTYVKFTDSTWSTVEEATLPGLPAQTSSSCALEGNEEIIIGTPPVQSVQCVVQRETYIETTSRSVLLLTEGGEVWRWYHSRYGYDQLKRDFGWPILSGLGTLLVLAAVQLHLQEADSPAA